MSNINQLKTQPDLEIKAIWKNLGIEGTASFIKNTSEIMFIPKTGMKTNHILSKQRFNTEFSIIK